jgi:hypothetical protein
MSRGQKGCYIYCVDPETNSWFRSLLSDDVIDQQSVTEKHYPGLSLPVLDAKVVKPYIDAVPLYDLQAAACGFSEYQMANEFDWVGLPEDFKIREGLFVVQIVGESIHRRIPNGAWCLFKANPGGTRQGKVVLVAHRDIQDPDHGGTYTVKIYDSEKVPGEEDSWRHSKAILKPDSDDSVYRPIILENIQEGELEVVGELVAVLG